METQKGTKNKKKRASWGVGLQDRVSAIHCGVVGNIQASHVCAPGSIPGDGVFFFLQKEERDKVGENKERDVKRGGAVVARQAHNLQVGWSKLPSAAFLFCK